jgi:hypothetical protein
MCPSCSVSRNVCYMCGADHAPADRSRALGSSHRAQPEPQGTLTGMPVEIVDQIISFNTDSIPSTLQLFAL